MKSRSSYCWGSLGTPHLITVKTKTHLEIQVDGKLKQISRDRIKGVISSGQRVKTLVSGGNWLGGIVLDGDRLRVRFDKGFVREIHNVSWMQIESIVPMPELEDYEADEMALAQQYDLLEPLVIGDRIRVVLAGPPLEHLAGLLGTVEGVEIFGLIPVNVDGHGSKVLRREQLDKVEPGYVSNPKYDLSTVPEPVDAENLIGSKVRLQRFWKNQTGVVKEVRNDIAMLWFRDRIPLYPCAIAHLHVLE